MKIITSKKYQKVSQTSEYSSDTISHIIVDFVARDSSAAFAMQKMVDILGFQGAAQVMESALAAGVKGPLVKKMIWEQFDGDIGGFINHFKGEISKPFDPPSGHFGSNESKKFAKTFTNKMEKSIKNKIHNELKTSGLDGNGRFPEADGGVRIIGDILGKYGFSMDMASKDMFLGDKGHRTFSIKRNSQTGDPFDSGSEVYSLIVYSWTQMSPGKFEIVVYLS